MIYYETLAERSPSPPGRDARVADWARLEIACRCKATVGSNPTLSATHHRLRSSIAV